LLPLGPLEVFELKTLDLRFRMRELWRHDRSPREVRAVELDDPALAALAHWPLPYETYAAAVDQLGKAGAGVIGLDVLLAPADTTRPREALNYRRLVAAVEHTPGVVIAVAPPLLSSDSESGEPTPRFARVPEDRLYPWPSAWPAAASITALRAREAPALELALAADRIGHVTLMRDDDGVVRRVPLLVGDGDICYPSFALQVVCERDGVLPSGVRRTSGAVELWREGKRLRRIPVDADGCLLVNYRRRDFDREADLSLADVATNRPRVDLAGLRGQVVLVGSTARSLGHFHSTPLAPQVADVHVLAEAIETVLSGRFLMPARRWAQFLVTWAFLLAGSLLMVRLPPWRGVLVGLGLMLLYLVFEKVMFIWGGRWFDFIGPMGIMQLAVIGYPLWSYRSRSQGLLEEMGSLRRFDDLILSTMSSGLLVADDQGRIVKSNARAARMLGFGTAPLDGRSLAEVFATSPSARLALERAMMPLEPRPVGPACSLPVHVPVVLESDAPDGDRLLDLSVSALDAGEQARPGTGRHYLLTFTDVTERVRLAQEDERRARLAAIGEIAAKLGHEIRNSLGGLRLYVENVREEIDSQSTARHAIDNMVEEIESLYRKIDELREYARDPILELSECDLKQLVEDAIAFSGQKLRDKHIQVVIDLQSPIGSVQVDRRQIRDAFQNLINNAVEAAPDGGSLRIGIERSNGTNGVGPPGSYLIHFEDDGPGIPAEVGDQVFSLFFTTKAEAGTGLGLSIVRKIVENHGGRVVWASRPGWTRFTVSLPPLRRGEDS
jgi:signal transduction histidine kinase/CHASE2 domain-containing sensor protein